MGAIVTIRDKATPATLQQELKGQADLHRHLVEDAAAGVAIVQAGELMFANQALILMFGCENVSELQTHVDLQRCVAYYDEQCPSSDHDRKTCWTDVAGPRPFPFEGTRKNGSIIQMLVAANEVLWREHRAVQLVMLDITNHKEAEHALAATAANFRDVIEGSLQGFYVVEDCHAVEDCRQIFANQAFADLLGYTVDEIMALPTRTLFPDYEWSRLHGYHVARLENAPAPDVYEVDALRKDGAIVRLQQCVRRIDNWFGKVAILGFAIDVTDRHKAEKDLKAERNLFRAIIDNIPAVVFAKDRDGNFLVKNRTGAEFVGESDPNAMIGLSNKDYYPQDVVTMFRADEVAVIETGEAIIDSEHEIIRPASGERVTISGCIAPLRDIDGEIIGIAGVSRDVTAHRRSEVALRESEKRLKDIVDVASDWFWEMDADLCFTYFSKSASLRPGNDSNSMLGKPRSHFMTEMDDHWRAHFDDLKHRRPFRDFRYAKKAADGLVYHTSVSGVPIFDGEGDFRGYRGAATNINKEVEAEQALAKERNLLRAIVDNIPDLIFAKDRQARFILKNVFDAKFMGAKTPQETIGKTDFDYYPSPLADEMYRDDLQVIESEIPIINKVVQLTKDDDGEPIWHSTTKVPLRDPRGDVMGLVGVSRDVTELKRLTDRLHHQATHDALTGLNNRAEFERCLQRTLDATKTDRCSSVLCYIDLDQFKMLNDSAGHIAGDQLLRELSAFLQEHVTDERATLARLGGDEFGLLLSDCSLEDGERIAEDLIKAVDATRFSWARQSFSISMSIGITEIDDGIGDVSDLLARADIACYAAKDLGRNRLCIYRSSDRETRQRHEELLRAASLKQAIENDGLSLVAQPIVRLDGNEQSVSHYEILLRLNGKEDETFLPAAFIPAAERYGLMSKIDQWVVCKTLDAVRDVAGPLDGRRFNINLSGQSLADEAFQHRLRSILSETTIPSDSLCFEITETAVISNFGRARHFVGELHDRGCRIALDDFGSGLSSFSYLKQFPLNYLKIDGSFIKHIATEEADRAIVEAINHVGHVCRLETVAECVENQDQLRSLIDLRVDYAQGLAVGPPEPLSDVLATIEAGG